jgi:hypothetical protein
VRILAVAPYLPYDDIRHAGGLYLLRHLHQLALEGNDVSLIVPGLLSSLPTSTRSRVARRCRGTSCPAGTNEGSGRVGCHLPADHECATVAER